MTSVLDEWAQHWAVSAFAIDDLRKRLQASALPAPGDADLSEARVQQEVRLEAAEKHVLLFRNNNGALQDATGRWVRYGLCNDSPALNKRFKSGDLVGLRSNGQFVSREIKYAGWRFNPNDPHEAAQMRWIELINANGGDAAFATGRGTL